MIYPDILIKSTLKTVKPGNHVMYTVNDDFEEWSSTHTIPTPKVGDWVKLKNHRDWQKVIGLHGTDVLHGSNPECFHQDSMYDILEIADEFKAAILENV